MALLRLGFRYLQVFLFLSLLGTPLMAVSMTTGGIAALSISLVVIVFGALFGEKVLRSISIASELTLSGLDRTLESIARRSKVKIAADIVVSRDQLPTAMIARSIGSNGTIFISQGMVQILSEEKLRELIILCYRRAQRPEVVLASTCVMIAHFFLRFVPEAWSQFLLDDVGLFESLQQAKNRTVGGLFIFLSLYPLVSFFFGVSKNVVRLEEVNFDAGHKFDLATPNPTSARFDPLYVVGPRANWT